MLRWLVWEVGRVCMFLSISMWSVRKYHLRIAQLFQLICLCVSFDHWVKIGFDELRTQAMRFQRKKNMKLLVSSQRLYCCVNDDCVCLFLIITNIPQYGGKNHPVYIWYRSPKNFRCSRLRNAVIWSFRRWYGRRSYRTYSIWSIEHDQTIPATTTSFGTTATAFTATTSYAQATRRFYEQQRWFQVPTKSMYVAIFTRFTKSSTEKVRQRWYTSRQGYANLSRGIG